MLPFGRVNAGPGRHTVGDAATAGLNAAFARMRGPGRDGTLSCTRAGSYLNPFNGSLVSANSPCIAPVSIGGRVISAYGCFRSRTNIVSSQVVSGGGWYNSGGSPTVTAITAPAPGLVSGYNVSGGNRGFGFGSISGTYVLTAWVRNAGQFLRFRRGSGAFNIFGSLVATSTWQRLSVVVAPDGASVFELYCTDGLDIAGVQLELAGYQSPYVPTAGSAVTCPADLLQWTDPIGWTNGAPGEFAILVIPVGWSAAVGAGHPSGSSARMLDLGTTSTDGINRALATGKDSFFSSATATSAASAAEASGVVRAVFAAWNGTTATVYQGTTAGTAVAATLNAQSWAFLGNTSLGTSAYDSLIAPAFFPGGLSATERSLYTAAAPSTLALAA